MTFAMRTRLLKRCNVPPRGAYRRKRTSSSIYRRCIVCATAWWGSGPRSSIRSVAYLLEHGITVRQRLHWLRHALPDILAQRTDVLSPRMVRILEDLAQDWRRLDDRIEAVSGEIDVLSKNTEPCRHLMTIPGIGPIISSAVVAAIGNGTAFTRGRDFAAWLGLVPKQISTGDRTILGRITKRGNRYLRMLFLQ